MTTKTSPARNRDRLLSGNGVGAREFRILRLKNRECQLSVIQSAIVSVSQKISRQDPLVAEKLAAVVVAGYRALDPRQRSKVYERVQLGFPLEREEIELPSIIQHTLPSNMLGIIFARPDNQSGSDDSASDNEQRELTHLEQSRAIVRLLRQVESGQDTEPTKLAPSWSFRRWIS